MKFMKIALSVVAIAAIATIYSTGAFVSQTHGMDNTVAGFLAISNAEMAQQVGGETDPSEGIPYYKRQQDHGNFCDDRDDCRTRHRDQKTKTVYAAYTMCDPCRPPLTLNFFNLIQINLWPKYSRLDEDGKDYNPTYKKLLLTCDQDSNGNCVINTKNDTSSGTHGNCQRYIGDCED